MRRLRKELPLLTGLTLLGFSLATGGISGVLHAPTGDSVAGALIVACFPTDLGCDEALSQTVSVSASGSSTSFALEGLSSGSYLLIAWQDHNDNGEMEEDEISVFSADGGEPTLLSPPIESLDFTMQPAPIVTAPESPTMPAALAGGWFQGSGASVHYYDPSTGAWAPPTGSGFRYTFAPNGAYEFSGLLQTTSYGCTSTLFSYHRGLLAVDGQVLMLIPDEEMFRSQDNCNPNWNYENEVEPETLYYMWSLAPDPYSDGDQVLELTELFLLADGTLDYEGDVPEVSTFFRETGTHQ